MELKIKHAKTEKFLKIYNCDPSIFIYVIIIYKKKSVTVVDYNRDYNNFKNLLPY